METLTRREADILLCIADAALIPDPPFLPIRETKTRELLDAILSSGPPHFRLGLRWLAYLIEVLPFFFGYRRRFRQLPREERITFLERFSEGPEVLIAKPLSVLLSLCYYSDDAVMASQGFQREMLLERGRQLREKEGRW